MMGTTVVDMVRAQVQTQPDMQAVVDARSALDYRTMWDRAGWIARELRDKGIGASDLVGLCTHRSAEVVVGILGILRAGAAYVPLDATYPTPLLHTMIESTAPAMVVGHRELVDRLPAVGGFGRIDLEEVPPDGGPAIQVEDPATAPGDLCYVLFTSGSTGTPKGVVHAHAALANLVRWQRDDSTCGRGHRTAQFAPSTFDVSFQEIFATLAVGGTLVCLSEEERQDPDLLWELLVRERVNRLFLPPVALQLLAAFADPRTVGRASLLEVITAGEQLQCGDDVRRLFALLPPCRLINQYGPTETHVVTRHVLPRRPDAWPRLPPIGTPIDNVRLHLLDQEGGPVSPGEVGELCIGGLALARGYWKRPDLTDERFVAEPGAAGDLGVRMYRTGDLCVLNANGEVEFVGRNDEQVKIHGYRVELAQVEVALLDLPGVRACSAVAVETGAFARVLVAHVLTDDGAVTERTLKAGLRERLPEYMVPSRIRLVPDLPRTRSGKIDRKAVQAIEEKARS
jgi:amino acid adenylation domain-containing protein